MTTASAPGWHVNYNETRKLWMVWRDESPAICYCLVEADAERIAALLNAARVA
jgi:hypothetical protein